MSHGRFTHLTLALLALAMFAMPVRAAEGEAAIDVAEEAAGPNLGNVSVSAGVDFTTEYFFRGIYQGPGNDEGIIIQPYLDLGFAINDTFSVYVGTWNSLITSDDDLGAAPGGGGDDGWYEADWYAGVSIALPANFTLDVAYVVLYGPSGGEIFAEEVDITLAYDDSEMWGGDFALNPYVMLAIETDGGSDGFAIGDDEGIYLELGIEPSFEIVSGGDYPITLSIPVTVGIGIEDYYNLSGSGGDGLGFVDVGLVFSVPLSFIPSDFGSWSAHAGIHFLYLGSEAVHFDEKSDDFHYIGTFGFGFEY